MVFGLFKRRTPPPAPPPTASYTALLTDTVVTAAKTAVMSPDEREYFELVRAYETARVRLESEKAQRRQYMAERRDAVLPDDKVVAPPLVELLGYLYASNLPNLDDPPAPPPYTKNWKFETRELQAYIDLSMERYEEYVDALFRVFGPLVDALPEHGFITYEPAMDFDPAPMLTVPFMSLFPDAMVMVDAIRSGLEDASPFFSEIYERFERLDLCRSPDMKTILSQRYPYQHIPYSAEYEDLYYRSGSLAIKLPKEEFDRHPDVIRYLEICRERMHWQDGMKEQWGIHQELRKKLEALDAKDTNALARFYLAETPFERLFDKTTPFQIPYYLRPEGQWVVAPRGRGKTTMLHGQVFRDILQVAEGNGTVILMESKGDLIDAWSTVNFAALHPNLADKVVILNPDHQFPLACNPLDIGVNRNDPMAVYRAIELLENLFASIAETAKLTPLMSTLFHSVLSLLIKVVPNPTLSTFRDILENGYQNYQQYIDELDPEQDDELIAFFSKSGFDSKGYAETKNQILWRLRHVMRNPAMKAMFNAPKTKIKMGELMDKGSIIIINAKKAIVGDAGTEFYQRYFITLVLAAAQERSMRPKHTKTPVYFYIDECQTAIARDEHIETINNECRSQNICMTYAHQGMYQIENQKVLGSLEDCSIRMVNVDKEAPAFVSRMNVDDPQDVKFKEKGKFSVFIHGITDKGVAVTAPYFHPDGLTQLTTEEQLLQQAMMWVRYCVIPKKKAKKEEAYKAPEHDGPSFDLDPEDWYESAAYEDVTPQKAYARIGYRPSADPTKPGEW